MWIPGDEERETQSDFDMSTATAEISDELFGQDGDEGEKLEKPTGGEEAKTSGSEGTTTADASKPSPQSPEAKSAEGEVPAPEENSPEVQALGAPKTWNKEEIAAWATVPKEIQEKLSPILQRREEDFFRGISMYKEAAELGQQYDKVVEPYRPMLAAENLDPVELFQSFAANHYLLSRGTDEQKIQLASGLLTAYNIPLAPLLNYIAENGGGPAKVDPQVAELRKEIADLKSGFTTQQTANQEAVRQQIMDEITAFAADKVAHPYFDEVADDITQLFASGMAKDPTTGRPSLAKAYEMAVYSNPVTRQKEIDRLTAERTSVAAKEEKERKDKAAKLSGDHVSSSPKSRDGTVPKGSMDDTLNETYDRLAERG